MLLRSLFADAEDPDYQDSVFTTFVTVKLNPNESVFDFTKRFGLLYREVVGSGQGIRERECIRYYLRALREHKEPRILYEVKAKLRAHARGEKLVLQEIQRELMREEEQLKGTFTGRVYDQTIVARHGQRHERSRRYANATSARPFKQTPTQPKAKASVQCYACLGPHLLRDCPVTSEADKKKIYEMHRKKTSPKPRTASAAQGTRTSAPTNSIPRGQLPTPKPKSSGKQVSFNAPGSGSKSADSKLMNRVRQGSGMAASRTRAHASVAASISAGKRKMAYASMAASEPAGKQKPKPAPYEGDIMDPFDVNPPPIDTDTVMANPNFRIIVYEDSVLLDSGASDCMVYSFVYLDMITSAYSNVCLADGTVHNCNYKGMMRISAMDIETSVRVVVPMTDCLLVPGLRTCLWSVSALSEQGHEVIFGFTTVRIILHAKSDTAFELRLNHPMLVHNGQQALPFAVSGLASSADRNPADENEQADEQELDLQQAYAAGAAQSVEADFDSDSAMLRPTRDLDNVTEEEFGDVPIQEYFQWEEGLLPGVTHDEEIQPTSVVDEASLDDIPPLADPNEISSDESDEDDSLAGMPALIHPEDSDDSDAESLTDQAGHGPDRPTFGQSRLLQM